MNQSSDKGLFYKGVKRSLKTKLSDAEYEFFIHTLTAFSRILPHTVIEPWKKSATLKKTKAWWKSVGGEQRRGIGLSIKVPQLETCLESVLTRLVPGEGVRLIRRVPDTTELAVCKRIVEAITKEMQLIQNLKQNNISHELHRSFDDRVVVDHLKHENQLEFDFGNLVEFLRILSEQSYENKSLSFGVLIKKGTKSTSSHKFTFPEDFENEKRFKAFTDGYRSAYLLDRAGGILSLVDLEKLAANNVHGEHYFPEWSRNIALSSRLKTIGLSLTRQGDILYFEDGSLNFTRRAGKWQYWNHAYIIDILKNKARAQRVDTNKLGKVVSTLYRYALDVSFRRSGGLFVILRNSKKLHNIVRQGDAMTDKQRLALHKEFEHFLSKRTILGIDRNVIMELSSIDGALVFSNNGRLLAYGTVLESKKKSHVSKVEGSRSKAAVASSHFGISIKISSDGGISMYENGKSFMEI